MLADAARARAHALTDDAAVDWALSIAAHVAAGLTSPPADPCQALGAYLKRMGVPDSKHQIELPGTPCDTCAATQVIPARVAAAVVQLAQSLGVTPGEAFLWTSRIGAMVLAHVAADHARNPHDALSALVLGAYAGIRREIDCDLAEAS
jgi:hypothetical protein